VCPIPLKSTDTWFNKDQWVNIILSFFVVVGTLGGAYIGGKMNNDAYQEQQKIQLKNVAKAIDIDLNRTYHSNLPYYKVYKNNSILIKNDIDPTLVMQPQNAFYDTSNGAFSSFHHDISMFDYDLSTQIFILYDYLLSAESLRQTVNSYETPDQKTDDMVRTFYNNMKFNIVKSEELIPVVRQQLKKIYDC
jgi:hypothetical protein